MKKDTNTARILVEEIDISELPEAPKKRRVSKKVQDIVEPKYDVKPAIIPEEIDPQSLTVLDQVRLTFSRKNILALVLGSFWAGTIPIFSFVISHYETNIPDLFNVDGWTYKKMLMSLFVLGGLIFSFKSTFDLSKKFSHGDDWKAFGSVLILEGVLIFSGLNFVSILALILVVSANIVSAAVNLVVKKSNPDVDSLFKNRIS
jgi:hypothetical protein